MTNIEKLQKEIDALASKEEQAKEIAKSARKTMKEKMKKLEEEQKQIEIEQKLKDFHLLKEFLQEHPNAQQAFENWMRQKGIE